MLQRVLEARIRNTAVLHSMHEGFEGRRLHIGVAAADQNAVAAGGYRLHGGVGNGIRLRDRLHFQVIAQDDALIAQLVPKNALHDVGRERGRPLFV